VVAVVDRARGGEVVALKETWCADAGELRHEFSLLARLSHPHLGKVYDWFARSPLGTRAGEPATPPAAYTQQLVDGIDLTRALRGRRIAEREAVFDQILRALAYLHALDIIHLDLKPENVLCADRGGALEARVIDFGLASFTSSRPEVVRGSRSYLAPERFEGGAFDPRSDLYALGVLMIEAWTGEPPEPALLLRELADGETRRAWLERQGMPGSWIPVATALTSRQPAGRPRDVSEAAWVWGRDRRVRIALHTPEVVAAMLRTAQPAGREADLAELARRVAEPAVAVVTGAEGSGRRTLVRAAEHAAQSLGHPTECWPLSDSVASWEGLAEALARLVGGAMGEALEEVARVPADPDPDRFRQALREASLRAVAKLESVGEVTGAKAPLLVVVGLDTTPLRAQILVRALVARAEAGARLPLALLVTATSHDGASGWPLAPLDRAAVERFLADRIGAAGGELSARLAAASGGQPWCLQQLLGLLVARGELRFEAGGWKWLGPEAGLGLPDGAEAAIAARLALVSPEKRLALGALAWLRFGAPPDEIRAVLGPAPTLGLDLEELEAAGLVYRDPLGSTRLAHPALAGAVAGFEPPGGAPSAHQRVLREARPTGLSRAWHLQGEAGARLAVSLGLREESEGHLERAVLALELALELRPGDPEALAGRARMANLLGPRSVQIACLEALLEATPNERERLPLERQRFWALTRVGDAERAEQAGRALCALARDLGDEVVLAEALVDLATPRVQRGDYAEGESLLSEARTLAERLRVPGLEARISNSLGNILGYRGEHARALAEHVRARALKAAEGDPIGERIALGNMGLMCLELGRSAEAWSHFAASLAMARRTGHRRGVAWSLVALAVLALEGGGLACARRRAEAAQAIAQELGDQVVALDALGTLAEVHLALGDLEEAARLAEQAIREADQCGAATNAAGARAIWAAATREVDPAGAQARAEPVARDPNAGARARGLALAVVLELQLERGDLEAARASTRVASGLEIRHLPPRLLWVAARAAGLCGEAGETWAAEARRRRDAWPERPIEDGVDEGGAVDGPCRASFEAIPEVAELMRGGTTMAQETYSPDAAQVAIGQDGALSRAIGAEVAAIVARCGAERGFLVGAEGGLVASRDADGDAVPGAEKKLPTAAIEQARRGGGAWVGRMGGGPEASRAVGAWVVPGPLGAGIVLQNRFQGAAIERLIDSPPDLGHLALLLRVRWLEGEVVRLSGELARIQEQKAARESQSTQEILRLRRELEASREQLGPVHSYPEILFASAAMKRMLRRVDKVIGADLPVYIQGETGTGKELVARAIHRQGPRAAGPFVAQNVSAVPPTLFESELFGHERGAFTGAERSTEGLFRRADGGSLFLDEIGDLALDLQAKLLRVLETREVRAVGSSKTFKVDVRIICATHRDLEELARKGRFREDLFYRLHGVRITVPPLRERPDDIPVLVEHFLRAGAKGGTLPTLGKGVMKALIAYAWPGNVRQLESELTRAALLSDGEIRLSELSDEVRGQRGKSAADPLARHPEGLGQGPLQARVDRLERAVLAEAMQKHDQNKSQVARELGLSRAGLLMKLKRLGV
jgi:DNA-binding NtrC family response regulator/tetratricopeptide (TPR) repeat protein